MLTITIKPNKGPLIKDYINPDYYEKDIVKMLLEDWQPGICNITYKHPQTGEVYAEAVFDRTT